MEESQTLIVRLDPALARRARGHLASGAPYEDLSEFAAVAIENQLALEGAGGAIDDGAVAAKANQSPDRLLAPPDASTYGTISGAASDLALAPFTNRLFPAKVAVRALANMDGDSPTLSTFQDAAAESARALGLRLRVEDEESGRKGGDRRWVALPVGQDARSACSRFRAHFTFSDGSGGQLVGPLAQLGLAGFAENGEPRLTKLGLALASAANPILDGSDDDAEIFSSEERSILLSAIRDNPGEAEAILEFARLVAQSDGLQEKVDEALAREHQGWSEVQCASHRAAQVGRLRELGFAQVDGRGPTARISVDPAIERELDDQ